MPRPRPRSFSNLFPTLRARGDYLAIMTLGFGEIVRIVAVNWYGLTRGSSGIVGIPAPALGRTQFYQPRDLYYLGLVIALFALLVIGRIIRSDIGHVWTVIRMDETVAESMGVNTHRQKLLAYALGGFFAGMIGVYFAHVQAFINPDSFALEENIVVLSIVILGGAGTLWGPPVGAATWIIVQEWAGDFSFVEAHPEMRFAALGLLIIVLIRFRPNGLLGKPDTFGRRRLWFGRRRDLLAPGVVADDVHVQTRTERDDGALLASAPTEDEILLKADRISLLFRRPGSPQGRRGRSPAP